MTYENSSSLIHALIIDNVCPRALRCNVVVFTLGLGAEIALYDLSLVKLGLKKVSVCEI